MKSAVVSAVFLVISLFATVSARKQYITLNGVSYEVVNPLRYGGISRRPQPFRQPAYQPQPNYENSFNFNLPPDISLKDAEWVCQNPKTKDMMVIATGDGPSIPGGAAPVGGPLQPPGGFNAPGPVQPQPPGSGWPIDQGQLVNNFQPETRTTQRAITPSSVETDGEGVIDIRLGNQ